jgi:hypothetical protein
LVLELFIKVGLVFILGKVHLKEFFLCQEIF